MENNEIQNNNKINNNNSLNFSLTGDSLLEYSNLESARNINENKNDKKEIIQSSLSKNPQSLVFGYNKLRQMLSQSEKLLEEKESKIRQLKILIEVTNSKINKLKTEIQNNKYKISNISNIIDDGINNLKNNDVDKKICTLKNRFELLTTENKQFNEKNKKLSEVSENYQIELENSEKKLKEIMKNKKLKEIENRKLIEINKESLKLISLLKENISSYNKDISNKSQLDFIIPENVVSENKNQNNIKEIKADDFENILNNLPADFNKNINHIINWIESIFNITYIFNNENDKNYNDTPKIKEIEFINFKDLIQCLNNKKNKIKKNLLELNNKYNEMRKTKNNLINKKENLDSNRNKLLNEKNSYEKEIKGLNKKIENMRQNLNLTNNDIQDEKKYLKNGILENKFNSNIINEKNKEKEINNLKKQNNDLFNFNYSLNKKIF